MDPQQLASILDFSPGLDLARKARSSFSTMISPSNGSEGFHLVVSFGRAIFRLDLDLVGIAIHSCLGGNVNDLHISHIGDQTFKISIISKAVGFMIYNLRSFSCKSFHCFFHLWGSGAPNWQREFKDWISEQSRD
jgi:hypothetical protein